jgi:hypothetical protein
MVNPIEFNIVFEHKIASSSGAYWFEKVRQKRDMGLGSIDMKLNKAHSIS